MAVIRRKPLISKIQTYPLDLYLSIHEYFQVLDIEGFLDQNDFIFSVLINLLTHFLFTMRTTNYYLDTVMLWVFPEDVVLNGSDLFDTAKVYKQGYQYYYPVEKTWSGMVYSWGISSIQLFVVGVVIMNFYQLFNAKRTYRFLTRLEKPTVNCYKEKFDDDFIWCIDLWDPSIINIWFFCWISPIHLGYYFFNKNSNIIISSIVMNSVTFFLKFGLFDKFFLLLENKSLIIKESIKEYDLKVLRPKLSPLMIDKGISSDINDNQVISSWASIREKTFNTWSFKNQHGLYNKDIALLRNQ